MVNMAEVRRGEAKRLEAHECVRECIHVSVSVRACTFAYVCMPAYVCDALEKGQGGWPGTWLRWGVAITKYMLNSTDES